MKTLVNGYALLHATLLFCVCSCYAQAGATDRLVVTFHTKSDAHAALNNFTYTQIVKRYGRRAVLQFSAQVDLNSYGETLRGKLGNERIENIELDHLISMKQIFVTENLTVSAISYPETSNIETISAQEQDMPQWNIIDSEPYGIHAEGAWVYTNSTPSVVVAVLDTGIAGQAADVFLNMAGGYDFISDLTLSIDGDGRDSDPIDPGDWGPDCPSPSWHGTRVSSILAARHDPYYSQGLKGIAQNISLLTLRVLGMCSTGYASDVADAIVWAAGGEIEGVASNPLPAQIISMSFAGQAQCPSYLQSAVTQATQLGSILIAAAGNSAGNVSEYFPANCIDVLAVSASTREGDLAYYSNRGENVALAAPGGDYANSIMSLTVNALEDGLDVSYGMGTSFSVPHVAGVCALLTAILKDRYDILYVKTILMLMPEAFNGSSDCNVIGCGVGIVSAKGIEGYLYGVYTDKHESHNSSSGLNSTDTFGNTSVKASTNGPIGTPTCNPGTAPNSWQSDTGGTQTVSNPSTKFTTSCPKLTYVCQFDIWCDTNANEANSNVFELASFNIVCCDSVYGTTIGQPEITGTNPSFSYYGLANQVYSAGYPEVLTSFYWKSNQNYYFKDSNNNVYGIPLSSSTPTGTQQSVPTTSTATGSQYFISGFYGSTGTDINDLYILWNQLCPVCPIGKYSNTGSACSPCNAGTYASTTGMSVCISCSKGYYSPSTALSTCTNCISGYYSDSAGLSACKTCSAGSYATGTGLSTCQSCGAGSYPNSSTQSVCITCAAGYYASATGLSACTYCGAGSYGAISSSSCTLCSSGKYSSILGTSSSNACAECSTGTFSQSPGSSACTVCGSGTVAAAQGATACSQCSIISCASTQYLVTCTASIDTSCQSCPPAPANAEAIPPPTGQTCTWACNNGYYQNSAQTACLPCSTSSSCAVGQFMTLCSNGVSNGVCTACYNAPANSYYTSAGIAAQNTAPGDCQYACNSGYTADPTGQLCCTVCTQGKYNTGCTSSSPGQCVGCTNSK